MGNGANEEIRPDQISTPQTTGIDPEIERLERIFNFITQNEGGSQVFF